VSRPGADDRDRHARAKEVFLDACELPPAERLELLDARCGDDDELRREVEALLGFDDAPATVSLPEDGARTPVDVPGYRVLQKAGEGGMGEVWEAEQLRPVRRRVALKLIRWGMDSAEVVARFETERQALALMSHPCIARVFDAGATAEGRPFFAMEYVPGEPITTYCDRHRLSTEDRLALFVEVCGGVQHAHQKGVIPRDLKPPNVLVTVATRAPSTRSRVIVLGGCRASPALWRTNRDSNA